MNDCRKELINNNFESILREIKQRKNLFSQSQWLAAYFRQRTIEVSYKSIF